MPNLSATPVMLGRIPFFQGLPEPRLEELSKQMRLENCRVGQRLSGEHTACFVYRGIAAVYTLTKTGSRKILFFQGPGALLSHNITGTKPNMLYYEVMEDAILLTMDQEVFARAVQEDAALSAALLRHYETQLWRMGHQLKNTAGYMPMERKLAIKLHKLLRDFGVSTPQGTRLRFPLTVTQLADFAGAPRETVSRALKKLADWDLILRGGRYFLAPSMDRLAEYCHSGSGDGPANAH